MTAVRWELDLSEPDDSTDSAEQSFPVVLRICAEEHCDTVLSRYNPTDYCVVCRSNPRSADRKLMRVVEHIRD